MTVNPARPAPVPPGTTVDLHVVVTCADTKRLPVRAPHAVRALLAGEHAVSGIRPRPRCGWSDEVAVRTRVDAWSAILDGSDAPRVAARDLYAGGHWHAALNVATAARDRGVAVRLWVCSAGYGLIDVNAPVRAYAATFAPGSADAIPPCAARAWWRALADWTPAGHSGPRSLTALAKADPATPILVAASPAYLYALQDDLLDASAELADPDRLGVISAGTRPRGMHAPLAGFLLPADGRLRAVMGGAYVALNARLAAAAVRHVAEWLPSRARLAACFDAWRAAAAAPAPTVRRAKRSDAETRAAIAMLLDVTPGLRPSAALERLRANGQACEQRRFRRLYDAVAASRPAARLRAFAQTDDASVFASL